LGLLTNDDLLRIWLDTWMAHQNRKGRRKLGSKKRREQRQRRNRKK